VRLVDEVLARAHRADAALASRRWSRGAGDRRLLTWPEAALGSSLHRRDVVCNLCGWHGRAFGGVAHSESALCPVCGSIARDRFLHWCWQRRTPYDPAARVLETSPRMGEPYRSRIAELVDHTASDYDESAHRGVVRLDLQAMDWPDASLDVVLTPHVLEHVPDTRAALGELFRVVRPGGVVHLQVPLPQARTKVPDGPEYHGDSTLVFWRFGWDLADLAREAGFAVDVLVTSELRDAVATGRWDWVHEGDDCDLEDLLHGADASATTVMADAAQAARHGFRPAYFFTTFELRRP
jgi:SAM-dependent methyltransferase